MDRFLFVLASLFLGIATLLAQKTQGIITGNIQDSQGALAGASVFLIRDLSTQEIVQCTASGTDGIFSMTVPVGDYVLGVSFIGYTLHSQPIHVTEAGTNVGSIILEETVEELQTVVVQGKIVCVRTQPDGFVVNVKDIRERSNDALDLLKLIPRVQVKGEQLSIIGKDKVLVKIGNLLQRVESSEIASVLKGYDAMLVDQVEVITQPPLRYDPDGNTAMIVLHTSSVFKEYMGGVVGTEEMWGGKNNFRAGGYGSLHYNRRGFFASIAPSINHNGSEYLEQQEYKADKYRYIVRTPSTGQHTYVGVRGSVQYEYGKKDLVGLSLSWNKKHYNSQFAGKEVTSQLGTVERVVDNRNVYKSTEPRLTAIAYWETTIGERGHQVWTELSYYNLINRARTDYAGKEFSQENPFLEYLENSRLNTSGAGFNNDYSFYLDEEHHFLLETGMKSSWSFTTNYRDHKESKKMEPAINQSNHIQWNELIVAPYVSSTLRFNNQWWMRLGLRYVATQSLLRQIGKKDMALPDHSSYNDAWLPMLHTSYSPSTHHQITLSLNSSIDRPKFKDLNPFVWQINEHSFYRGNTKLQPQFFYTTSLGYTFMKVLSIRAKMQRGLGIITAFSTMQGQNIYTQVENAQNNLFLGLEAGYYFDKLSWLNVSIDGYYGRNRYSSRHRHLPSTAQSYEWGVNGYLDFTFNKSRTLTGYISGDYTGRKKTTVAVVDPQYEVGAGINCFLMDRRLTLSIAGMNLFSSAYKGYSYRNGYTVSFNNRYNYPTLYLSISYKFSNAPDKSTSRLKSTRDIERRF